MIIYKIIIRYEPPHNCNISSLENKIALEQLICGENVDSFETYSGSNLTGQIPYIEIECSNINDATNIHDNIVEILKQNGCKIVC